MPTQVGVADYGGDMDWADDIVAEELAWMAQFSLTVSSAVVPLSGNLILV